MTKATEKLVYARYMYNTPRMGKGWIMLPGTFRNTDEGHTQKMREFTKRDGGKTQWIWKPVRPGDYDYPKD